MNKNGSFLTRMERKWGKYAIPNLTMYMIGLYVIGLVLELMSNGAMESMLNLDMNAIFHGQVWRLLTFLLIPKDTSILVIITLFFYASIGRTLEQTWGAFYYNVYMFAGILFTILGNVIAYGIQVLISGSGSGCIGTNYYIILSLFLAFAYLYPDLQVLLMFIIPIKVKWMAYLYYAFLAYDVYQNIQLFVQAGYYIKQYGSSEQAMMARGLGIGNAISIVMSILNFFIFYYLMKKRTRPSMKTRRHQKEFRHKMVRSTPQGITRHKCAVCGATEETNPELEFRFCSKCNGNYEYCQNHLFSHEHVK